MAQSIYIAAVESKSGKSLITLGLMEWAVGRVKSVRFFRPVIRSDEGRDREIELIRNRYRLPGDPASLYGYSVEQARELVTTGQTEAMLKGILERYRQLEREADFVVCEGTDYAGVATAFEFDFNAQVAGHLGCPVLIVASGRDKDVGQMLDQLRISRQAFRDQGCTVSASVLNRVRPEDVKEVRAQLAKEWSEEDPVFVVPEDDGLSKPTLGELMEALQGELLYGETSWLHRVVRDHKVAAMRVANFLDHIRPGTLVITPGDREDILLAGLASVRSAAYPDLAGIVLTGGIALAPQVRKLLDGLRRPEVPVIQVATDTYATAIKVESVRASLAAENEIKIASALGLFQSHVDRQQLERRLTVSRSIHITPLMFEYNLIERARSSRQHIVLPEGTDERILHATQILLHRGAVELTLLGSEGEIRDQAATLGLNLEGVHIVDPGRSEWRARFAETYYQLRQHKGITREMAEDAMGDVSYFGTMMVHEGLARGMVSGAAHTTAHTIRPALEIIRTRPGCSLVSGVFLMCLQDRVLVYGDCAINPDPDAAQLADIAIRSAETALLFGIEPRVAMLSYSTGDSGRGAAVEKVREATRLARELRPDLRIEGPIQYDAAIDATVARAKLPGSEVAGRATVFVFPDLNTGNNTYKAVQRSAGALAIGPVLQGLKKPVNDLSRGCTVPDIVNTVAITAIQAQASQAAS